MVEVVADVHERGSGVPELLRRMGAEVRYRRLSVGDYVVSEGTAVERKSAEDYLSSLFSGRLFEQVERLREAYENPVVLVEGSLARAAGEEHSGAVWGSLFSIAVERGVAVLQAESKEECARAILILAKREQGQRTSKPRVRHKPRMLTLREQQRFLVCGLPGVGEELAERLLRRFRTPRRVFAASRAELMRVEGIGRLRAARIAEVLDREYVEDAG